MFEIIHVHMQIKLTNTAKRDQKMHLGYRGTTIQLFPTSVCLLLYGFLSRVIIDGIIGKRWETLQGSPKNGRPNFSKHGYKPYGDKALICIYVNMRL